MMNHHMANNSFPNPGSIHQIDTMIFQRPITCSVELPSSKYRAHSSTESLAMSVRSLIHHGARKRRKSEVKS